MPAATTSSYLYNKQLTYLLSNTGWTPPTSIWVALFTTIPALAGTGGVEVTTSASNYGRVSIAAGGWVGPGAETNLEYSNSADIQYLTPSANWGTIVGAGLYDSDIGGNNNLLFTAQLTTPKTVNDGDGAPKILANQLRITRAT